jgi:4-carboxymuconolactone decarboxylase
MEWRYMNKSRYEIGMRVRREVLGDAHVERAAARTTAFDADFQRLITETAWGSVWARPGLARPTRSLITIAMLAALGRGEELALHLRASRNTGATPEQIAEALVQLSADGVDGLVLSWVNYPRELRQFIAEVLPLLEQAGLREAHLRERVAS